LISVPDDYKHTDIDLAIEFLNSVHVDSISNVSEVSAAFIFRADVRAF
jgi:hypothetical protein